ncbi:hypothetical protein [Variovorax saccharolyticus]|uniref:hypothetical protein n=1 Tax=Variovorax saccharolyticus TaxID=3053516 RepID=UPI002574F4D1|nr:hypothetical protein [Variovorax sp. J31P216]MDM0029072.1 hypothetical protein [Variovorax sp. J31P216]
MAMDLLKQLASSPLPAYFSSPEDIDKIRLLRAAGLVQALVPADRPPSTAEAVGRVAEVTAITPKGREALLEAAHHEAQAPGTAADSVRGACSMRSSASKKA